MKRTLAAGLFGVVFATPLAAQTCNPSAPESTPTSRFSVNGDGTVTDRRTGLIWKRCPEGQSGSDCATGSAELMAWGQALERARDSLLAGKSDWRLPNIKELQSIVETRCIEPSINQSIFSSTPSTAFWSSSPEAYHSYGVWVVGFYDGYDASGYRSSNYAVRLVRGGQ